MNIEILNLPDVTKNNIQESKVLLADSIIENIYPLFDNIFMERKNKIEELSFDLKRREVILSQKKTNVEQLIKLYQREKLIVNLLSEIENLVNSGLVNDSGTRHQVIVLLKTIDKLSEENINKRILDVKRILGKKFSK
jgi:hypothetical protein